MSEESAIELVPYRDEHLPRFAELNRAWLVEFNLLEPPDVAQLEDPRRHFVATGGELFIALRDGSVVGTAAVLPYDDSGAWEIAKLAVDPIERGRGIGRQLIAKCIAFAKDQGAQRLVLVSNHQLVAALRMYEAMGFEHRPIPETCYLTADVYMEMELT